MLESTTKLAFAVAVLTIGCADATTPTSPDTPTLPVVDDDWEQAGEIEGDTSAGDGLEVTPLPPPISEEDEMGSPPKVPGKEITTKEFTSGIVAVYEGGVWIASFTKGARTVRVAGKPRTLRDPTDAPGGGVTHDQYVRLLPEAFTSFGDAEKAWLAERRNDTSADVLAVATEYFDGTELDAKYVFGADYDDYLAAKDPASRGIDCSGFVRLVYGKRTLPALLSNGLLPRVSKDQLRKGTGVLTVANVGKQPPAKELQRLRPGDLVFFDVSTRNDDAGGIDHVGLYVGKDASGKMRFANSTPNNGALTGPTMAPKFVLDGTSFWAKHFRAARRL